MKQEELSSEQLEAIEQARELLDSVDLELIGTRPKDR